ncbi:hypothetical protein Tco_0696810 [Tanacetum coccineum]
MVAFFAAQQLRQWQHPFMASLRALAHFMMHPGDEGLRAFRFEDSCAIRDDLRKAYEKCTDISQESRAMICTFLKESSGNDRKLHLSMFGKASRLEKHIGAKLAWLREKYSYRTREGIDCSSSQANCSLTEKDRVHQLRLGR